MEPESCLPNPAEMIVVDACHLRIPSLPDWIEPTIDFLVRRAKEIGALPKQRIGKVTMALHEALTNSVIHGNLGIPSDLKERGDEAFADMVRARCADPQFADRVVDIRATYDGEALRLVFTDEGAGFDTAAALARLDEEPDPMRPSGRGLLMIRAFVDDMRYEEEGRRLQLTIRRPMGEERRRHERIPLVKEVKVTPIDAHGKTDPEASQVAWTRNISATGISLLQARLADRRVLITFPTDGDPVSLQAEVRHWHTLGDNVIEVGCRFEADSCKAAEEEPIARLVMRLAEQQPITERRFTPRVPYTECISVERSGGREMCGFGRDLSRVGIAFFLTTPLPVLELIDLTLPQGEAAAIHTQARVVRCTRLTEGFYDVAAEFLGR